jgi:predicted N-formylglutamate amidohydrolase
MPRVSRFRMALLQRSDPPAVVDHRCDGRSRILLVCDHASAAVPAALSQLGLSSEALARHIGWDIGAAALTRALAERLDARAILAGYSRLVVDCNRHPDDPSSMLALSDGERVPGNEHVEAAERAARLAECFDPYHAAISAALAALQALGAAPMLVAIHSFTPALAGRARPWHVGILWDRDPRLAAPLLAALRTRPGLVVGDNEPYSGRHPADYTVHRHGAASAYPHVCIEVRQDQIDTDAGVERWAGLLATELSHLAGGEY